MAALMRRRRGLAILILLALALVSAGCRSSSFGGPLRLLDRPTTAGSPARVGRLESAGDSRPALLESARYRVPLPRRPLLTFGMGLAWAGADEAPGWYRLIVRAGERTLFERKLNPRALRGFRDVSLPLDGAGDETELAFDLQLTDRDGRPIPQPAEMLIGVSDPVIHDLDAYGRAKGVLLVSIDTLRRDHVGTYGYAKPTTPRLDALAREGLLFDDAVSTSSWTLPAHLSMLTSTDPSVHGGVDMNHGFNRKVETLASLFRGAGYSTQAVTSHLYVSSVYGVDDGFDHLDFHQDRKAGEVADRALALLDRFGDRPFFVFLHFYDPHWHYDPPAETLRLFETGYAGALTGVWQDFRDKTRATTSEADLRHLLALYDGEIRYTDDQLGRVLDHLKARGLDAGTLVLVTSDHGEEFLDHGSWEHQKTLFEEVVRVPMMLRGPGVPARREAAQVSLLDVAPTLLAWAGLPPQATHAGRNLLGALGDLEAYGETDHTDDGTYKLFLRSGQGRWKTILSLDKGQGTLRKEQWYDLATDPAEHRDSPPRAAVAEAIRSRALDRWRAGRARGSGAPGVTLSPEQRERLRALGYVGP
jgi:arylsulfatase A-like enzyme